MCKVKRFNVHIQSTAQHTFVMGASSNLGQLFRPRQKKWGLGWKESRLYRFEIRPVLFINRDNKSNFDLFIDGWL